jgi:hypothetical protein
MKNYELTLGVIFNNEAPYLKEWVEHNLNRGFDHIYMIDDNSDDDFMDVLNPYKDHISIFHVNERIQFNLRQQYYYNKFIHDKLKQTKWIAICDVDEYIWSPIFLNLKDACRELQNSNIYSIAIPMILFGSNGHIHQPYSIVEGFTMRSKIDKNYIDFSNDYHQYKSITWASEILELSVHSHWLTFNQTFLNSHNLETDLFRLNHYRLQSEEKWRKNLEKFDVNNYVPKNSTNAGPMAITEIKKNSKNYRTMELFYEADKNQNEIEDLGLVQQNKKHGISFKS